MEETITEYGIESGAFLKENGRGGERTSHSLLTLRWKETEHWLPPRRLIERRDGKQEEIDQDYCFTRVDGRYRYEVSMQQIINI